jgi:transketolase
MLERLDTSPLDMKRHAARIRQKIIKMICGYGKGHTAAALSWVEIATSLFFGVLRVDPENPKNPERDRFLLSKGHGCTTLYATLAERGYFQEKKLDEYYTLGSCLGGHPVNGLPGVEVATGSLGHGLPIAVGMALAAKTDGKKHRIFTVLGDGELQEGSVWEACLAAAHFRLDNLVVVVDRNYLESDGPTEELMALEPLEDKFRDFNWGVRTVDGHDCHVLVNALREVPYIIGRPSIVLALTVKGKGIDFMENVPEWHNKAPVPGSLQAKECFLQIEAQLADLERDECT